MRFSLKKRADEEPSHEDTPEKEPAQASGWTHGRELLGKVVIGVVWAAVLSGPVALGMLALSPEEVAVTAAPVEGEVPLTASEQAAGPYSASFVAAWLTATKDQHDPLDGFVDTGSLSLGETGWKYRDLAVASIARESARVLAVRIAVNVQEVDYEKDDAGATVWPRRYFQVPVAVDGEALGVLGFPTPVSGPVALTVVPHTAYRDELPGSHPAAETVESFLNAYLAGSGELDRYLSPGANIEPMQDPPYVAVSLDYVMATSEPAKSPVDGDIAQVYVSATVINATQMSLRTEYSLTLTARDGRWEVTSIDSAPVHGQNTEPTAPASVPPTQAPQEGKSDD